MNVKGLLGKVGPPEFPMRWGISAVALAVAVGAVVAVQGFADDDPTADGILIGYKRYPGLNKLEKGFEYKAAQKIFARLGSEAINYQEFATNNWRNHLTDESKVDFAMGMISSRDDFAHEYAVAPSYIKTSLAVMTLADQRPEIRSKKELRGLQVCVVEWTTAEAELKRKENEDISDITMDDHGACL